MVGGYKVRSVEVNELRSSTKSTSRTYFLATSHFDGFNVNKLTI